MGNNFADMSINELREHRNSYVKQYIGDINKPINYNRHLAEIDALLESKRRATNFAQSTSKAWKEFLAR